MKKKKILWAILAAAVLLGGCTTAVQEASNQETDESETPVIVETAEIPAETVNAAEYFIEESTEDEESETLIAVESEKQSEDELSLQNVEDVFDFSSIPAYQGKPYVEVHENTPFFTNDQVNNKSFEHYSNLDSMGRCGTAYANIGQDLMPTEERGEIGSVKPTGWHTVKYDNVDGKYLYNRCHLIGYQLTGENANEKNLITGTRYLNIQGMLPFENMVADYVKETANHVLYRVTPVFEGNNLLAAGVLMEGYSVEDDGAGICYCVFAYNVQPGIDIEYATGDSEAQSIDGSAAGKVEAETKSVPQTSTEEVDIQQEDVPVQNVAVAEQQTNNTVSNQYILNTNTKKFHNPSCSSVDQMKESNKQVYNGSRDDIIAQGYEPCKKCNP